MGAAFGNSGQQSGSSGPTIGYDPNSTNNQAAVGSTPGGGAQSYVGPNQPYMGAFNQSYPMLPFQPKIGSAGYFPMQQQFGMMPNYMYQNMLQQMALNQPMMGASPPAFARGGRVTIEEEDPIEAANKILAEQLSRIKR